MITREQCRAARGLLEWTQQDLAHAAGLSKTAVNNFERGLSLAKEDTLRALRRAFEKRQVEFIGTTGVQKKVDTVSFLKGSMSFFELLEDVLTALAQGDDREFLVCNASQAFERKMIDASPGRLEEFHKHCKEAGITQRTLLKHGDHPLLSPPGSYRWMDDSLFEFGKMSFIYGRRMAIKFWYDDMIIIVDSPAAAHAEKERFSRLWNVSAPPLQRQNTSCP